MARNRDVDFRVTSNEKAYLDALNKYGMEVMNVAGPRAINRTVLNIRTRLSKEIRESYSWASGQSPTPARRIRSLMRTTRANHSSLQARIDIDFRSISLKRFRHRMPRSPSWKGKGHQTGAGVVVTVAKGGSAKVIRGAFGPRQRTPGGVTRDPVMGGHIFMREPSRARPTKGHWIDWAKQSPGRRVPMRQRITKLQGPSIRARAGVLLREWREDGWLQERLAANIEQEARGRVSQLARQAARRGARGRR